ncbi:hypothetical protein LDENG_00067270 [Lucifuga dentata]|nr:hypothetical protein LDENG_00067270 [Lucifuga dentata]
MLWGCFGGERFGDLVQVKGIVKKENCHSILQRHTISSSLQIIFKISFFNRTTIQNIHQNYAKITSIQKKSKRF